MFKNYEPYRHSVLAEAAQKAARESAQKAAQEAAQKAAMEAAQKAAREAAQKAAMEAAQKAAMEAAQKAAMEAAQKAAKEAAEEAAQRAARDVAQSSASKAAKDAVASAVKESASKNASRFMELVKNNPKLATLGITAVGVAAYAAATGQSFESAFGELAGKAGNVAVDLVNNALEAAGLPTIGGIWDKIKKVVYIVLAIIVLAIIYKIYVTFIKKPTYYNPSSYIKRYHF
jgi:membrane protein involved in colicin uptake